MTEGILISPQGDEAGSLAVRGVVKVYVKKTTAPTVNDDITEGYKVSDMWIDETNDKAYQCLDNSDGVAVWTEVSLSSSDHVQGTDTTLGAQTEVLDMNDYRIVNLANATDIHNAVTLEDLLNSAELSLSFWLQATSTLGTTYTANPSSATEEITGTPQELTTANTFFKSTEAETPTPFVIKNGTIILTHIEARVESTGGTRPVTLHAALWIADSDGNAESQIGADSDATAVLTDGKILYELHLHVATETIVAATKRLFLRIFATTTGTNTKPTVRIYYGDITDHINLPVADVLSNFLQLSGGTMTGDIAMGGSQQVTGLQAPDTNGEAIRQTAKITEVKMEAADDHVGTSSGNPHSVTAAQVGSVSFAVAAVMGTL